MSQTSTLQFSLHSLVNLWRVCLFLSGMRRSLPRVVPRHFHRAHGALRDAGRCSRGKGIGAARAPVGGGYGIEARSTARPLPRAFRARRAGMDSYCAAAHTFAIIITHYHHHATNRLHCRMKLRAYHFRAGTARRLYIFYFLTFFFFFSSSFVASRAWR